MTTTTLQLAREQRGWSRGALAERAHVAESTIYRIERGISRRVGFEVVRRLAAALGVDPAVLNQRAPDAPRIPSPPPAPAVARLGDDDAVLFVADLARILRCGRATVLAVLHATPERLPRTMDPIDSRPRWAREIVIRWIAGDASARGTPREPEPEPEEPHDGPAPAACSSAA